MTADRKRHTLRKIFPSLPVLSPLFARTHRSLLFLLGFGGVTPGEPIRNSPGATLRISPQLWNTSDATIVAMLMNAETMTESAASDFFPAAAEKKATRRPNFFQQIYQCLAIGALGLASYLAISHFVLQSVRVVGVSMVPTLHDADQYLLNRWIYYLRNPKPRDIVVLRDPMEPDFAVKRIIGVAGDRVVFKEGRVYVNGRKLNEPYLAPGTMTFPYYESSVVVPKGQFFVLGDNRRNSADSRTYGPVPRQSILGLIIP